MHMKMRMYGNRVAIVGQQCVHQIKMLLGSCIHMLHVITF